VLKRKGELFDNVSFFSCILIAFFELIYLLCNQMYDSERDAENDLNSFNNDMGTVT
jgi:hypothetical protein